MFYIKKLPIASFLLLLFFGANNRSAIAQDSSFIVHHSSLKWVNPFIGTGGHGHTFPGATMPFGMVQLSPDTRPDPGDWDGCGGYHFSDSVIYGFSHTHLSGTGVSDYCDVLLQPVKPGAGFSAAETASLFYKKNERAEAGFYEVFLEKPQVNVELTASERVGFHKYTFPKDAKTGIILLDLYWRDLVLESEIDPSRWDEGIITGYRFSRSWATDQRIFFFLKFSKPPIRWKDSMLDRLHPGEWFDERPPKVHGMMGNAQMFEFDVSDGKPVVVECAISSVNVAGAEANWKAETTNFDFEKAKNRAQTAWQKQLSKIEIEGGSDRDRTVFYTALYHTMIAPNIFSDVDGRYRGRDQQIHQAQKGATMYTVFSLWDTYRALHPLMTILEPDRVRDWMYTFWRQSEEGGKLPVWELAANETNCMIGNHSIPVIADAYLKGLVPDSLIEPLYQAMKKAATDGTRGLDLYDKLGYIPSDLEPESVSKTIEYSFDDWCIAQIARGLGKSEDVAFFSKRAENPENLEDPATYFFRPKSNGTFIEPFDPTEVNFNFTEGNAWQFAFLHNAYYSDPLRKKSMGELLEEFFATTKPMTGRLQADLTGATGQFVIGNEPDMHTPFLFNSIDRPGRTDSLVIEILSKNFSDQPDGLPGNDDCGQTSAWVVWAMMGLYPANPVGGALEGCKPNFSKLTIHLDSGKSSSFYKTDRPGDLSAIHANDQLPDANFQLIEKGYNFFASWNNRFRTVVHSHNTGPVGNIRGNHLLEINPGKGQLAVPYWTGGQMVFNDPQKVVLHQPTDGASIYFTLDGTEPTEKSAVFSQPILIEKSCTLKAFAQLNGQKSKVMTAQFTQQADRKNWKTTLQNQPNNQYTARGDRGLIDGLRGGADFRSGGWMGFDGKELELVLDMGEAKAVSKLGIGFLQDDNSWIFIPQMVFFETSLDGKNWESASTVLAKRATTGPGEGFLEDFETTLSAKKQARFIKIKTQSYLTCPAWHKGVGSAAWLFADEIWVE